MRKIRVIVICFLLIVAIACLSSCSKQPDIEEGAVVSFGTSQGAMQYGACGFLYGIAEDEVPSQVLMNKLNLSTLSTKTVNGLQHPTGDVSHVASSFLSAGGDTVLVYMQDIYPDWYYAYRADYDLRVAEEVAILCTYEYADSLLYYPYNEMNNGVWYGDFSVYANRLAFYEAWKNTYNVIKGECPTARIAGPGHSDYNPEYTREFLTYARDNDCLPDVMVWHELSDWSAAVFTGHYNNYRQLERELGIAEREICINEYGSMKSNGNPGETIKFISALESAKVDGCIAFWRLADNLCELANDSYTPTAAWWLYYWYSMMKGESYAYSVLEGTSTDFSLITSYDNTSSEITVIFGGKDGDATIYLNDIYALEGMSGTSWLDYYVERIDFNGLTGECYGYEQCQSGNIAVSTNGIAKIKFSDLNKTSAYRLVLCPSTSTYYGEAHEYISPSFTRLEAEDFADSPIEWGSITYATSGGGTKLFEDDAIAFKYTAPQDGTYAFDLVYATNNKNNGVRANSLIGINVDGSTIQLKSLSNTLSDTATSVERFYLELSEGEHTVCLSYSIGDVFIDYMDVSPYDATSVTNYILYPYSEQTDTYFSVVPTAGYYILSNAVDEVNGYEPTSQIVYLRRGVNDFKCSDGNSVSLTYCNLATDTYSITSGSIVGGSLQTDILARGGRVLHDLDKNGEVVWNVSVAEDTVYALTFTYSNDEESGVHAYNVDLVERYAFVEVNGVSSKRLYFRNTYGESIFNTLTIYVDLNAGQNTIRLYTDGAVVWQDDTPYAPNIATMEIAPLFSQRVLG